MTPTDEMTMTVGATATVDPGTYSAYLAELADFEYDDGEGNKTLRRWTFALEGEVDSEGKPAAIDGVSSLALGPKSKAFAWMSALLGRVPVTGEQITRSQLIGLACLVTVVLNQEGYSKISAVVPAPRKRAGVAAPVAAPAATAAVSAPPDADGLPAMRGNDEGELFPEPGA